MSPPIADPLYLLAFDHRDFFVRELLGEVDDPDADRSAVVTDAKQLCLDGLLAAAGTNAAPGELGILVDDRFGLAVAARARKHGVRVAMPAERSGRAVFELQHGAAFGERILRDDPDITKVLVRWNPDGDAADNEVQGERLRRLSEWLREHGRAFLFELLVEPTPAQLEACGGDAARFEAELRPELIRRAVRAVQAAGIEPEIWKVEGIDDAAAAAAVAAAARDGREHVRLVVLGSGAGAERVDGWLRTAARTEGYCGFAIGRSIWWPPLRALRDGECDRPTAVGEIAARYRRFVDVFADARAAAGASA